ncbi:hypothetical protein L3X38_043128 [Prunus dulcis]|uniref:Annexin 5 n=1 Tax=Prunus dulcis TaxID=3755 RepID=A0AAD4UY82_PRUDU|nr:hypothetical protein L3X38_043128 [Prunus dulcis]
MVNKGSNYPNPGQTGPRGPRPPNSDPEVPMGSIRNGGRRREIELLEFWVKFGRIFAFPASTGGSGGWDWSGWKKEDGTVLLGPVPPQVVAGCGGGGPKTPAVNKYLEAILLIICLNIIVDTASTLHYGRHHHDLAHVQHHDYGRHHHDLCITCPAVAEKLISSGGTKKSREGSSVWPIIPPVLSSPRDDAIQLHRAFKGFGCHTTTVINILAHIDATQRAYLKQEYKTMYHEELSKRLSSELSGNTKKSVLLWMHDPATRDATIIRQALGGEAVVYLKAATEVICSRTPSQILQFKNIYFATFGVYLEHDIEFQAWPPESE